MGKTQLFRILSGLQVPTSGEVRVGKAQEPVTPGKVGVVAQSYPLFEHRTVLGNLVIAGANAGLSRGAARAKAEGLLLRFGLADRSGLYPAQLSGGQRQRAAIAQQFMGSEHFLLMDEPFSGLDPLAAEEVCALISETAAQDELNTIIVITHDIAAAASVCDTLWLLGRDRDSAGNPIPGARLQKTYDLAARGLAWREGAADSPPFAELVREVREAFRAL